MEKSVEQHEPTGGIVSHETLMCGGKKCCPTITVYGDGSVDVVDLVDGKLDSVHLDPNQVKMLRDRLNQIP